MTGLTDKQDVESVSSSFPSQEYGDSAFPFFDIPCVFSSPREEKEMKIRDLGSSQRSLVFGHTFPCGWDWETHFLCPGTAGPLMLTITPQYGTMPPAS